MTRILPVVAFAMACAVATAQPVIMTDDFSDPARSAALWSNQRGNWQVVSGAYGAQSPNNNPLTFTAAPFVLADLDLECDIVSTDDGGLWLHADATGQNGVLLVFAGGRAYWHHVVNGNPGGIINQANSVYAIGQSIHVRVTVVGNVYTCFVNGVQRTSYTTSAFPSGRVGLYDFRNPAHNYDNVVLRGVCATGDCCPVSYVPAATVVVCPGNAGSFTASPAGSPTLAYEWQIEDAVTPGVWHDVAEGEDAVRQLTFTGSQAATLSVLSRTDAGAATVSGANFRCVVSNGCGADESGSAAYTILQCCPDVNCDFALDGFDVEVQEKAVGGDVTDYCLFDPDFNGDFALDGFDVEAVEVVVGGGPCP